MYVNILHVLFYVYIIFLVYIVLHNGCTVLKSLIV